MLAVGGDHFKNNQQPTNNHRYESEVGTFENAVPLDTSFFRESWGELERLVGNADRNAPIMTYCTGGIRCVKVRYLRLR